LPSLTEQRAIAAALSDVDALLTALDALIDKKRLIKQGAMQELLTGKTRLPGFSGEWEVKKVEEILRYEQPSEYLVRSEEYTDKGDTPVLTAGKTFILGYTNEADGIYRDLPVIIFDDFTLASRYVDFQFKVKSSAIKLLKTRDQSNDLRFVFEKMQLIKFSIGDHKRYYISEYQHNKVKVPSVEEQKAIVSVLSDMDSEISALEQQREKTRLLKQGMMQELLTGRTRLNHD
jgi:type I restriction enzyme S subunit